VDWTVRQGGWVVETKGGVLMSYGWMYYKRGLRVKALLELVGFINNFEWKMDFTIHMI